MQARSWLSWPLLLWLLCSATQGATPEPETSGHAVILLYHRVAESTPASTSVTPATFEAHLDYLTGNGYTVLPLGRVIDSLAGASAAALPPKAVAITFDDAYGSVFEQAAPRLSQRGMPYAVFVSTDYIDRRFGDYMSWDQLRELENAGAEIGNHSRNHAHYAFRRSGESAEAWRERIAADIRAAQSRLDAELQAPLRALAYPYGEFTPDLTRLAADLGYPAFGQQSGPAGPHSDPQALPRFPMAAGYASLDGLAEKLRTRPFTVEVLSEVGPILQAEAPAPALRLRLQADRARLDALSCFVSGQSAPHVDWIDLAGGIVEVTARQPLPVGRSKYTCTAPATGGGGVYYWYSHLWMTPPSADAWYAE